MTDEKLASIPTTQFEYKKKSFGWLMTGEWWVRRDANSSRNIITQTRLKYNLNGQRLRKETLSSPHFLLDPNNELVYKKKTKLSDEIRHTFMRFGTCAIIRHLVRSGKYWNNGYCDPLCAATMGVRWKSVQFSDLHVRSCLVSLKTIVQSGTWPSSGVRSDLGVSKTNPLLTLSSPR